MLEEAEQLVSTLRGTGPQVLRLPHLLDRTFEGIVELEETGVDMRAERVRFETVQRQLRRQQVRFLAEAGEVFGEERAAIQPDRARWWWFIDGSVAEQRQERLRRTLTWGAVAILALAVAWFVYDRYIAPPPEVREALRLSSSGESLAAEGDLQAALAEFEAAVALNPDDAALWLWVGVIHSELDELDEAQSAFDVARSLYEAEQDFLLQRGITYLRAGNLDAAEADAEQVITGDPQSGWGYFLRGNITAEQGDFFEAAADLERAAELAQAAGDLQLEATARTQRAMVMQMAVGGGP
jgi:tetratricopeptide (TPR) repeat protein